MKISIGEKSENETIDNGGSHQSAGVINGANGGAGEMSAMA
jgi:hypothetical protein